MKQVEAIETLRLNYPDVCDEVLHEAVDDAITALAQTERIALLISNSGFNMYLTMNDFDDQFQKASIKEIKETMWELYCLAIDVSAVFKM